MKLLLTAILISISVSAQTVAVQPDHIWQGSGKYPVGLTTIQKIPGHMNKLLEEFNTATVTAESKAALAKTKELFQAFGDRLPSMLGRINRVLNQGSKAPVYIITDFPYGPGTEERQKTFAVLSQEKVFNALSAIRPKYVGIVGQYDDPVTPATLRQFEISTAQESGAKPVSDAEAAKAVSARARIDGVLRYQAYAGNVELFGLDEDPSLTRVFNIVSGLAHSGNIAAKVLATDLVDLRANLALTKAIEKTGNSPANRTAIVMATGYDSVTSFACLQAKMACLEYQAIPSDAEFANGAVNKRR